MAIPERVESDNGIVSERCSSLLAQTLQDHVPVCGLGGLLAGSDGCSGDTND